MSNEKIKSLLGKLHDEIGDTPVDEETRSLLRILDADIDDLLDEDTESSDVTPVLDKAQQLETSFAATHPVAVRFVREIVDVLAKMGV